jgi:hypothetical protein
VAINLTKYQQAYHIISDVQGGGPEHT